MKIFVETADVEEIRELSLTEFLVGVTTKPSLFRKSGYDFLEVRAELCRMVSGPVSAEVIASEGVAMFQQGKRLAGVHRK